MRKRKRARLEGRGWKFGDASEFLGLTKAEAVSVEERLRRKPARSLSDRELTETADVVFQELDRSEDAPPELECGSAGRNKLPRRAAIKRRKATTRMTTEAQRSQRAAEEDRGL
jgi:hypothetical protein